MKDRIEIEKVENGYQVTCWNNEEKDDEKTDFGYVEPKKYVAKDEEEVMELIKKYLP